MAEIRRRVRVTREVEIVGEDEGAVDYAVVLFAAPCAYPWTINLAVVRVREDPARVEPVEPKPKRGKRRAKL